MKEKKSSTALECFTAVMRHDSARKYGWQTDLARMLDKKPSYISHMKSGKKNVAQDIQEQAARALGYEYFEQMLWIGRMLLEFPPHSDEYRRARNEMFKAEIRAGFIEAPGFHAEVPPPSDGDAAPPLPATGKVITGVFPESPTAAIPPAHCQLACNIPHVGLYDKSPYMREVAPSFLSFDVASLVDIGRPDSVVGFKLRDHQSVQGVIPSGAFVLVDKSQTRVSHVGVFLVHDKHAEDDDSREEGMTRLARIVPRGDDKGDYEFQEKPVEEDQKTWRDIPKGKMKILGKCIWYAEEI